MALSDINASKSFVESLLNEFRLLAADAKRFGNVKEACERAMTRLHNVCSNLAADKTCNYKTLNGISTEVCQPLLMATKSKQPKLVQTSLSVLQKLISHQLFDTTLCEALIDNLWHLADSEIEELRVLQTMTLLGNSPNYITGNTLAKTLVICFRMNFAKDAFVINTASATVRQLVAQVFERCKQNEIINGQKFSCSPVLQKLSLKTPPTSLNAVDADAYMLFQDLCRLINAEPPMWLVGITEMTRTLGLDLLDTILSRNVEMFSHKPEFVFVLKELVCPLVIKLFSPNLKCGQKQPLNNLFTNTANLETSGCRSADKPYFPIVLRLNRLVLTLITCYYNVLSTECEIFISLLLKFLDQDKLDWYRALAVETVYKIVRRKELLSYFCEMYDSKPYSTKVVRDLVSCVQNFLRLSFTNRISEHAGSVETCELIDECAAFFIDNSYVPFLNLFDDCSIKVLYTDMLEKVEPPEPPRGYFVSATYLCVSAISNSTIALVDSCASQVAQGGCRTLSEQLLLSTSNHLLSCYSTLLDNCLDELLIDDLLKRCCDIFSLICRFPSLNATKRCYVSFFCNCSLPSNYFSSVLQRDISKHNDGKKLEDFDESRASYKSKAVLQKVYVTTSPCPAAGMPNNVLNTRVTVTLKNLYVARYLLEATISNAQFFDECWNELLMTLQHLCWVLGLKPSPTTGLLEPPKTLPDSVLIRSSSSNLSSVNSTFSPSAPTIPTLNYVAQIAFNCSSLFRKTAELSCTSLLLVIDALCRLSEEACKICAEQREPSLFAICKFVELTSVNLFRSDEFLKRILDELIKLCYQSYFQLRECSTAVLVSIVNLSLVELEQCSLNTSALLIDSLRRLNRENPYIEVVQQQLNCVLQILHSKGQILNSELWSPIIESIGNIFGSNAKEVIIRQAFQAAQLISNDCMACLPISSFHILLEVVLKFGCQCIDTNISLSAIGLLWNINDYLFATLRRESRFELWMHVYSNLAQLCVDYRPAVRKSACETLFGTLHAHCSDLSPSLSYSLLSQVLLPLLEKIEENLKLACVSDPSAVGEETEKSGDDSSLLIHHSRDTKDKQWAETASSALSGVCKFFQFKYQAMTPAIEGSLKLESWAELLSHICNLACSTNDEVSIESLKCFTDLVSNFKILLANQTQPIENIVVRHSVNSNHLSSGEDTVKLYAWQTWCSIALNSKELSSSRSPESNFFILLLRLFVLIFDAVKSIVDLNSVPQCFEYLNVLVSLPWVYCQRNAGNSSISLLFSPINTGDLIPIQRLTLDCLKTLGQELSISDSRLILLASRFVAFCLNLSDTCQECCSNVNKSGQSSKCNEILRATYDRLAQLILRNVTNFYKAVAASSVVVNDNVAKIFLQALHKSLAHCGSNETCRSYYFKQSVQSLAEIVEIIVPDRESKFLLSSERTEVYAKVADCVEAYLLSPKPKDALSFEEQNYLYYLDNKLVDSLKSAVLPNVKYLPVQFSNKIVSLLQKASIQNYSPAPSDCILSLHKPITNELRIDLPMLCLNALSEVSLKNLDLLLIPTADGQDCNSVVQAADACLSTCKQIIASFIQEMRSSLNAPIARHRIDELVKVLNSIDTLVDSLKLSRDISSSCSAANSPAVDSVVNENEAISKRDENLLAKKTEHNRHILMKLFDIYPMLVDLIECNNRQIRTVLIKTLKNFAVFLT